MLQVSLLPDTDIVEDAIQLSISVTAEVLWTKLNKIVDYFMNSSSWFCHSTTESYPTRLTEGLKSEFSFS